MLNFHYNDVGRFDPAALAALGEPILDEDDLQLRMAGHFDRAIGAGNVPGVSRNDAAITDASENFMTFAGQKILTAITREPKTTGLTMPGKDQVVPVRQVLDRSEIEMAYEILQSTGSAEWADPAGMRRVGQGGEFAEQRRHRSDWAAAGYGWGMVELWQKSSAGRNITMERANAAGSRLRRFCERVGLHGDLSHEIPGLLTNGQGYSQLMGAGFSTLLGDPDAALLLLQIIEHSFDRAAENFGGTMTNVIAPKGDKYALQRIRYGTNGEGEKVLTEAAAEMPWVNRIKWVDGLETASSQSGPLWVAWSQDSDELWHETSPSPMLFGPFTDGANLRTSFVLLAHEAGLINKRLERKTRFNFAA